MNDISTRGELGVGSRVMARADGGRMAKGERGIVYDVRGSGDQTRYGILSEKGECREYSAAQVKELFDFTPGDRVAELLDYRFENAGKLLVDFQRGRFRPAFPPLPRTAMAARS